ncbi:MAG: alpha-L-fucosidase [Phycisphaerae bacterium]|nr:alpha-L-fucosidase [Phycisphaerae bacterium]
MKRQNRFVIVCMLTAIFIGLSYASAAEKKSVKDLQDDFRDLKFGMFLHYNMATYKEVQWVAGYPSPADFNPGGKVDTDAWADAAVAAGMKYGVLTAKHVGGFCLWDSKYTTYDIMHPDCPYKQDLVAQFIQSFKSRGLKVGLYYCWRHPGFAEQYKVLPPECDPATHTLKEQNEFQKKQIAELIEKYPDVFYIWNDGLDDEVMTAQDAKEFFKTTRPNVLTSSNWWDWGKKGTPFMDIAVKEVRHFPETNTAPGETCWKLESGWFWKKGTPTGNVKGIMAHMDKAYNRNSNFLLNVGPDKNGNFQESSVKALTEIGKLLGVNIPKKIPAQLPDPDTEPPVTSKPEKVYILAGQSNMVGIGQISGGSSRWGQQFIDPVVSIYEGPYSPTADYETMTPIETKKLESFGGTNPTPYPKGGTAVTRGFIQLKSDGVYEFNAGYGASADNIMEIDGKEVYRKEAGKTPVRAGFKFTAEEKYPFKITYLNESAGGLGWLWRTDFPGTLDTVVKTDKKFPHLIDDKGNWTVRNDVWYKGVVTATANKWLTVGCGAGASSIGPELQFGHIMGYYHDEPVIIIKASQGNRSLGWDFLPPSSQRYTIDGKTYAGYKDSPASWPEGTTPKPINWYAGKQYDDCFKATHNVLDDFANNFPQWKDQGYEIAGFVWWQGHKDGNEVHATRYEQNLVNLIKSLRSEFKASKAPFVIATIGFGGWNMTGPHVTIANAQLAVSGEKGKYPEFAGNVLTVETRDFWKDASISPRNQDFHYNGNAETYMMVGDALGRGMVKLLNEMK